MRTGRATPLFTSPILGTIIVIVVVHLPIVDCWRAEDTCAQSIGVRACVFLSRMWQRSQAINTKADRYVDTYVYRICISTCVCAITLAKWSAWKAERGVLSYWPIIYGRTSVLRQSVLCAPLAKLRELPHLIQVKVYPVNEWELW